MKAFLFLVLMAFLALTGCSSGKNLHQSTITEGISGRITITAGNQMPMKGAEQPVPRGTQATVLVYEPTNLNQVTRSGNTPVYTAIHTKRVASVETDSTGSFSLSLPPGSYSVFIKQGGQFYANLFDTRNNIALFVVEPGKVTPVNLTVSVSASY